MIFSVKPAAWQTACQVLLMTEACKILRTSAFLKDWMVNVNLSCCVTWLIAFCLSDVSLTHIGSSFMNFLHCLLSCAVWVAVCRSTTSIFLTVITYDVDLRFLCPPRLLLPWTYPFIAVWKPVLAHSNDMSQKIQMPPLNSVDIFNLTSPESLFCSLSLFVTPSIMHRHALLLVCWWWFYWTLARPISSVVTTTSIILGSSKIRNRDILVPAYPVCSRNWPVERMLSSCFLSVFVYCSSTERSFSGQSTADLVYVLKSSLPSVIMSLKMTYVNIEFNGIIILFLTWFVCFQLTTYRYWV